MNTRLAATIPPITAHYSRMKGKIASRVSVGDNSHYGVTGADALIVG
jgi:hypothetical protein